MRPAIPNLSHATPKHVLGMTRSVIKPHHKHHARRHCTCAESPEAAPLLCALVPRHRFATSRYNTLILLFLRLFYQAAPFAKVDGSLDTGAGAASTTLASAVSLGTADLPSQEAVASRAASSLERRPAPSSLFGQYDKVSTSDWPQRLSRRFPRLQRCRIVSMSWVKALASPFSHEFVQFIVEDPVTLERARVAAGREELGDWVHAGWDWTSEAPPSHHYMLPLPLLSITFDNPASRPSLDALAGILKRVSESRPEYSFVREMCWWYAETVFEEMYSKYGGKLKEWEWAKLRYSFIVKTSVLPRIRMTKRAQEFRKLLAEDMSF